VRRRRQRRRHTLLQLATQDATSFYSVINRLVFAAARHVA